LKALNIIESVGVLEPTGHLEFHKNPGKCARFYHVFYRVTVCGFHLYIPIFTFRIIPPVISPNIQGQLLRFGMIGPSKKTYRSKTFQTSKEVLLMASEIRRSPVEVGSYWRL